MGQTIRRNGFNREKQLRAIVRHASERLLRVGRCVKAKLLVTRERRVFLARRCGQHCHSKLSGDLNLESVTTRPASESESEDCSRGT